MHFRPMGQLLLATVLLLMLPARVAVAGDGPSDAQLSAARDLFIAAEKDEDAQRWSDALEKLKRVAQVKLTPGVRYHTALCEEHLGRLVAALSDYKAAANEARAENASDVLRLVDRRILDSTERVPRLVIVLVPSLPEATVRLDGEPISPGVAISTDPGTHTVDATAPGHAPSATRVTLQERDATSIEVKLEPAAPPPPPPPAAPEPRDRAAATEDYRSASRERTLGLLAAAGAVGLAAGGLGAYLAASGEHANAVQTCGLKFTSQADACDSLKNDVRAWDWVAVTAWAGAAAAGTVAALSLVRFRRDSHHAGDGARSRPSSPSARVVVAPTSVGLEGTF
jgi:hypothetical protein